ncbi:hypothetical protein M407DRAFT_241491 [Tulasnella calospora MUT 4182]|uniref:NADH-ubiquinone oxidoreductase B12 subunit n=1 Tax=Tulasnella calospora MUT 4182 TaxID=1051891 RepID=A0A0C3QSZ5_9AGAM|nr:hypothetical protein M407DRAFT_241491 [Tulasnella calospora MUT 4182]
MQPSLATRQYYRDPWAKREAWRKHPMFTHRSYLKNAFPGFGIAVVAFTAYVVYDNVRSSSKPSSGQDHHH